MGHPAPWHMLGTSVPGLCKHQGHTGDVTGSEFPAAHGLRTAECGPTGLWRSPSRSAGFLERLEPAPAAAASREVLPAPAEPCAAPGHGPEPAGQAQPADGTRSACSLLCANTEPCFGGTVPRGNRERGDRSLLEGSSSLGGACPEEVEKGSMRTAHGGVLGDTEGLF